MSKNKKWEVGIDTHTFKICIDKEVPSNMACQGLVGSRGKRHYISYIASSREMAITKLYRYLLKEIRESEYELRKKKKNFWDFYHNVYAIDKED